MYIDPLLIPPIYMMRYDHATPARDTRHCRLTMETPIESCSATCILRGR